MRLLFRFLRLPLFATLLAAACVHAQQQTVETGTVTGKVTCSDTRGPARMAKVLLVPMVDASFLRKEGVPEREQPREPMTQIYDTGLDGTFTLPKVLPGKYYLVPQKLGYLQPLGLISREALNKPDAETAELIARLLTPVIVVANRTTQVEAQLVRGATISGRVLFDDGTPVTGVNMEVLKKDAAGKWKPYSSQALGAGTFRSTDDAGNFRIGGMPSGEYTVTATLALTDLNMSGIFGGVIGGIGMRTRYSLKVFYGDRYRQRDAKVIKLSEGEMVGDSDITMRLAGLHALSGAVVERNGQTVNSAKLTLAWKDDGEPLATSSVMPGDGNFQFAYVPEGEYTLKVTDARDVALTQVANCKGCMPEMRTEEKTLRTFGPAEMPLSFRTDMQAFNVTVPPAAATPASQAAPAAIPPVTRTTSP